MRREQDRSQNQRDLRKTWLPEPTSDSATSGLPGKRYCLAHHAPYGKVEYFPYDQISKIDDISYQCVYAVQATENASLELFMKYRHLDQDFGERETLWNRRVRRSCAECSKIGTERCEAVDGGFVCHCKEHWTVCSSTKSYERFFPAHALHSASCLLAITENSKYWRELTQFCSIKRGANKPKLSI